MKRYSMELGSKNVSIVMPDADLELAVEGIAWGAFATSGQRCTATSRVVVACTPTSPTRSSRRCATYKVGTGLRRDGRPRAAHQPHAARPGAGVHPGRARGRRRQLLTGGHVLDDGELAKGNYIAPTVFADATPAHAHRPGGDLRARHRGHPRRRSRRGHRAANATQFGLSASIYTNDMNAAMRRSTELEFGIVYVNAPTIGAEVQLPFGGMKSHRQRLPRGGPARARRVQRVEGGVDRLQPPPAEGAVPAGRMSAGRRPPRPSSVRSLDASGRWRARPRRRDAGADRAARLRQGRRAARPGGGRRASRRSSPAASLFRYKGEPRGGHGRRLRAGGVRRRSAAATRSRSPTAPPRCGARSRRSASGAATRSSCPRSRSSRP